MAFISSKSDDIERQRRWQLQQDDLRYNMIHGEHGLFAAGSDELSKLAPAQRDVVARGVDSCAAKVRQMANTQTGSSSADLHAVADKVQAAAGHIRQGEGREAKAALSDAGKAARAAGYPGVEEQVHQAGSNWLAAVTGKENPPSFEQVLQKYNGDDDLPSLAAGHINPVPGAAPFGNIDYGTLG